MLDWRTIKKIDAHIHILPDEVHEANPDSEDRWVHAADLHKYCKMMDELGIEKAVIMPFNDPWLMSMESQEASTILKTTERHRRLFLQENQMSVSPR